MDEQFPRDVRGVDDQAVFVSGGKAHARISRCQYLQIAEFVDTQTRQNWPQPLRQVVAVVDPGPLNEDRPVHQSVGQGPEMVIKKLMNFAVRHELLKDETVHDWLQPGHIVAGKRQGGNQACRDCAGAGARNAAERVPGIAECEDRTHQPDAFDPASLKCKISDQLLTARFDRRIYPTVGLQQLCGRRSEFRLEVRRSAKTEPLGWVHHYLCHWLLRCMAPTYTPLYARDTDGHN